MAPEPLKSDISRSRWREGFVALVRLGLIIVWISFLLSLTVSDTFSFTATLVYATPWLVRLTASILAIIVLRKQLWWMSGILLISGLHDANESRPEMSSFDSPAPGSFTVATWNTGRKLDDLRSEWHFESDVVAIIESGHFDSDRWRDFKAISPEYRWLRFDNGTIIGVRGELSEFEDLGEPDLFKCYRVKVTVDGHPSFNVVVVDMRSQPWLSRKDPMHRIFNSTRSGEPAIILGDFNTPPDSRWMRNNTSGKWWLANRSHSQGFIETWPYGLPVHCLDQIWISGEFHAVHCRQEARPSDHRLVEARIEFGDPQKIVLD